VLAIAIATPGGVGSLTIRLLAQHRGVKPMAIRTRLLTDTSSRAGSRIWTVPGFGLSKRCSCLEGSGRHHSRPGDLVVCRLSKWRRTD
jgi:hypothetical protein